MYQLHIANKNYSSWSLRPWVLMTELGIAFEEQLHPFEALSNFEKFRAFSPTGLVPCLLDLSNSQDGDTCVWDSLAIVEYLHEHHPSVWPADARARAFARSAAAEMHSGFTALRNSCPMNCAVTVQLNEVPDALQRDLNRLDELWCQGLDNFGGPFLAGGQFTAVDAFYCPVAFRVQSYQLPLSDLAMAYSQTLLGLDSMQAWYQAGLQEPWIEEGHEDDIRAVGKVMEDKRTRV